MSNRFDFWTRHKILNHPMVVMVEPNSLRDFHYIMNEKNFIYSQLIDNFGRLTDFTMYRTAKAVENEFSLKYYNSYEAVNIFKYMYLIIQCIILLDQ